MAGIEIHPSSEGTLRVRRALSPATSTTTTDTSKPKRRWPSRAECFSLAFSISAAVAATIFMLWALDFLSTGAWEDKMESRAVFVLGDTNGDLRKDLVDPRLDMQPTMVAFYSETCPHCKKMRIPFMQTANEFEDVKFMGLRISQEDEKNKDLARSFGVTHIPTLFFVSVVEEGEKLKFTREKYERGTRQTDVAEFVAQQLKSARMASLS